jgi:hypothetical protein
MAYAAEDDILSFGEIGCNEIHVVAHGMGKRSPNGLRHAQGEPMI